MISRDATKDHIDPTRIWLLDGQRKKVSRRNVLLPTKKVKGVWKVLILVLYRPGSKVPPEPALIGCNNEGQTGAFYQVVTGEVIFSCVSVVGSPTDDKTRTYGYFLAKGPFKIGDPGEIDDDVHWRWVSWNELRSMQLELLRYVNPALSDTELAEITNDILPAPIEEFLRP